MTAPGNPLGFAICCIWGIDAVVWGKVQSVFFCSSCFKLKAELWSMNIGG